MTKLKIGDEVKVVYMPHSYRGDYKQGMIGKIIEVSQRGRQLKLHGDNIKVNELWLDTEGLKLVEPQYPNPPLPHCEERIAFAKGANIESKHKDNVTWWDDEEPQWLPELKYRAKVEKTKDDLRIEVLESLIIVRQDDVKRFTKELAELKPTAHY
tara:strand:+ start:410 stop:874 length:465 start_codon:yes stop_codon:yes gene_type:complete